MIGRLTLNSGRELARPFEVAPQCYDCTEFYHGCNAWPVAVPWACGDFLRLPDVMPGTTGQVVPPSRMQGRKAPRGLREISASDPEEASQHKRTTNRPVGHARTPSPAASYGPDGERRCECGAALQKRQRCCDACRQKRREATLRRRRNWKPSAVAV